MGNNRQDIRTYHVPPIRAYLNQKGYDRWVNTMKDNTVFRDGRDSIGCLILTIFESPVWTGKYWETKKGTRITTRVLTERIHITAEMISQIRDYNAEHGRHAFDIIRRIYL